jgi:hypothetical protein
MSEKRLKESVLYRYRIRDFLLLHPYCQVWLEESGILEEEAKRSEGLVRLKDGSHVSVPLAVQVHHRNKRRSADLLDQSEWLAVSREAHAQLEGNKAWARLKGYLRDF